MAAPGNRLPRLLFANRYEAAAFWACIVGLVLALGIVVIGLVGRDGDSPSVAELTASLEAQSREIARLQAALEMATAHPDSVSIR